MLKYDSNVDIRTLHIEMISTYVALLCASKACTSRSSLIGGPFNKMRLKIQNTKASFLLLYCFQSLLTLLLPKLAQLFNYMRARRS